MVHLWLIVSHYWLLLSHLCKLNSTSDELLVPIILPIILFCILLMLLTRRLLMSIRSLMAHIPLPPVILRWHLRMLILVRILAMMHLSLLLTSVLIVNKPFLLLKIHVGWYCNLSFFGILLTHVGLLLARIRIFISVIILLCLSNWLLLVKSIRIRRLKLHLLILRRILTLSRTSDLILINLLGSRAVVSLTLHLLVHFFLKLALLYEAILVLMLLIVVGLIP